VLKNLAWAGRSAGRSLGSQSRGRETLWT